ncbi:hypothetical protein RRG08_020654 [Elysia crispata]|uniref:Uncharacterized protein n=1 Tax=Elysia crispata TaxID=231223 RepID=A0AAE0Z4I2_9GAST|nr:hypothetical protein RRG08_020654 [Elysia crispata]
MDRDVCNTGLFAQNNHYLICNVTPARAVETGCPGASYICVVDAMRTKAAPYLPATPGLITKAQHRVKAVAYVLLVSLFVLKFGSYAHARKVRDATMDLGLQVKEYTNTTWFKLIAYSGCPLDEVSFGPGRENPGVPVKAALLLFTVIASSFGHVDSASSKKRDIIGLLLKTEQSKRLWLGTPDRLAPVLVVLLILLNIT